MSSLPVLSGRQVASAFERAGWSVARQRGSHIIMTNPTEMATLSVPDHKEVARGTLRALIRASGLSVDAFLDLAD
jgi:predicted RNA binding protein YcfA (HicA-like mRNA interferase family)